MSTTIAWLHTRLQASQNLHLRLDGLHEAFKVSIQEVLDHKRQVPLAQSAHLHGGKAIRDQLSDRHSTDIMYVKQLDDLVQEKSRVMGEIVALQRRLKDMDGEIFEMITEVEKQLDSVQSRQSRPTQTSVISSVETTQAASTTQTLSPSEASTRASLIVRLELPVKPEVENTST